MIRQYKLTIGAGDTETLQVQGNFIRFRQCNDQQAEIQIRAEDESGNAVVDAHAQAGQGINGAATFKNLRFTNTLSLIHI